MGKPGVLRSVGSWTVGHDLVTQQQKTRSWDRASQRALRTCSGEVGMLRCRWGCTWFWWREEKLLSRILSLFRVVASPKCMCSGRSRRVWLGQWGEAQTAALLSPASRAACEPWLVGRGPAGRGTRLWFLGKGTCLLPSHQALSLLYKHVSCSLHCLSPTIPKDTKWSWDLWAWWDDAWFQGLSGLPSSHL